MTVVTTLDIADLTPAEYRAVLDELGVEKRPEAGIYLHLATPTDFGFRILEIWDHEEGFDRFLQDRLTPASKAVGLNREIKITVTPLHNLFAPRLDELSGLVPSLPGAPRAMV
jgi:hypothetical protein